MKRLLMLFALSLCFSAPAGAQEIKFAWDDHPSMRAGDWLQVDFRARVQNDTVRSEALAVGGADNTLDAARRRVGIEGRVFHAFDYQAEYEIGSQRWRDAYLDYRQFKVMQVQAGQFKVPFSLDQNTGVTNLDFVYRSGIATRLAPGRDRGVMVHGSVFKGRLAYESGLFQHDGENAQPSKVTRVNGGRTAAARAIVKPFGQSKSPLADFQAGIAITGSDVAEGFPSIRAKTVLGESFFGSDLWVKGRRQRTGLEMRWRPGPFSVQAEYIRLSDARRGQAVDGGDLTPLVAQGWYVSGTYAVTGERKSKGLTDPRHRFGALELAARFEAMRFGSTAPRSDLSTSERAEVVSGNAERATTAGANWYLNRWVKLQANVVREQIHDPSLGPLPGKDSFWSRVLRVQFTI